MQKDSLKIDQKDLEIIKLYSKNPSISQEHISKKLGISQPTIALRVKRLKETGIIAIQIGTDVFKLNLCLAKIEIRTKNPQGIISDFKFCPFFLNGFMMSGKHNLTMLLIGKDITTLECIVNRRLRTNPQIQDILFNIVISSTEKIILPIKDANIKHGSPHECQQCPEFQSNRCGGCMPLEDLLK